MKKIFFSVSFIVVVFSILLFTHPVFASNPNIGCQQSYPYEFTPLQDSYFVDYEQIEYQGNYLVYHVKLNRASDYLDRWNTGFVLIDDQCRTRSAYIGNQIRDLDPSVRNISYRFDSPTHYQIR